LLTTKELKKRTIQELKIAKKSDRGSLGEIGIEE